MKTMKHHLQKIFFWNVMGRTMKVVILTYIIGFLLWFGLLWFDWLLLLIPFLILFLYGLVFAIYLSSRKFRREKSWRARLIGLIPLAIVLAGTAMLLLPRTDWKVHVDHCLFQKQRLQAMEDILRENPRIESRTQFDLPHWWLSSNGTVWVFEAEPEWRLVGFPVTTGLLSPCWMVVYSVQDHPPTERELLVGEVRIFKKLSPHWYYLWCG